MKISRWLVLSLLVIALAGCRGSRGQTPDDIPTPADIDDLATAVVQTRNAPPPGFDTVSFPMIDDGLTLLPGWRYVVLMEFDGSFEQVARETNASAQAEIKFNQLASAREVDVTTEGELLGQDDSTQYKAVRLGPDAFLVRGTTCLTNADDDAQAAADLRAGDLIGGVNSATTVYQIETINGTEVHKYGFSGEDVNLPMVTLNDGGSMTASGELWVAPEHEVVVRYYANIAVSNARLFDRDLPVSGEIRIRYDVHDIGTAFNIAQPFGC